MISNWHHHANLFLSKLFPMRVAAFWGRVDIALSRFSPTWPVIPLGRGNTGRGDYIVGTSQIMRHDNVPEVS